MNLHSSLKWLWKFCINVLSYKDNWRSHLSVEATDPVNPSPKPLLRSLTRFHLLSSCAIVRLDLLVHVGSDMFQKRWGMLWRWYCCEKEGVVRAKRVHLYLGIGCERRKIVRLVSMQVTFKSLYDCLCWLHTNEELWITLGFHTYKRTVCHRLLVIMFTCFLDRIDHDHVLTCYIRTAPSLNKPVFFFAERKSAVGHGSSLGATSGHKYNLNDVTNCCWLVSTL